MGETMVEQVRKNPGRKKKTWKHKAKVTKNLEFEYKDEVFGSTYVTKEDLYRIVCGVTLLADGLLKSNMATIKERGVDIKVLAHKLDQMAQRVKAVEGNIVFRLMRERWMPVSEKEVAEESELALAK